MSHGNKSFETEEYESPFVSKAYYDRENTSELSAHVAVPRDNGTFQQPLASGSNYMVEPEFEELEESSSLPADDSRDLSGSRNHNPVAETAFFDNSEDQERELADGKVKWLDESMIEELESDPAAWLGPPSGDYETSAATQWPALATEVGENLIRDEMEAGLFTSELFEAVPEDLERVAPREHVLVADGKNAIKIQEDLVNHFARFEKFPQDSKRKLKALFSKYRCVGTSLFHLSRVCRSLNVTTDLVSIGKGANLVRHRIPRILRKRRDGAQLPFSWKIFLRIWYSSMKSRVWKKLDPRCRGGGAAGALLYAGLAENDTCITSNKDERCWPGGLRPGAFLQLWLNEETYKAVKNGDRDTVNQQMQNKGLRFCGHSCILRNYYDNSRTRLVVADQMGLRNDSDFLLGWGRCFEFLIGANLKRVKIVSRID